MRSFALLALAASLSACSTITTGTTQSMTVSTDPSGATCHLTRGARTVAVVNPTPGTVTVDKSKDSMSVLCRKDGFQDTAQTIDTEFQAMTLGNVLIGGVVGLGVDIATGAINKYPTAVVVPMQPSPIAQQPNLAPGVITPPMS